MQAILIRHDTKARKAQVWISFVVAATPCRQRIDLRRVRARWVHPLLPQKELS